MISGLLTNFQIFQIRYGTGDIVALKGQVIIHLNAGGAFRENITLPSLGQNMQPTPQRGEQQTAASLMTGFSRPTGD
jgi:hypothetical protein